MIDTVGVGFLTFSAGILAFPLLFRRSFWDRCGTLIPFITRRWTDFWQREKREEQWPDAIQLLAGSMKAGMSLPQALEVLLRETPEPLRSHLRAIKVRGGDWFSDSPLHLVRATLQLSKEAGGRSPSLLERSAKLLRLRLELAAKGKMLTAQSRLSAWVLGSSPFCLMLIMKWTAPELIDIFFTTKTGGLLLLLILLLDGIGLVLVFRMARVEP